VGAAIMGEAGPRPDHVSARETPRPVPQVSLRTFDYNGHSVDRGQIFRLAGMANDKRMADLRYFTPLEPGTTTYECSACGCTFTSMGYGAAREVSPHETAYVPPTAD
jgi:hypothetical protein